jgi:hypothetical protein
MGTLLWTRPDTRTTARNPRSKSRSLASIISRRTRPTYQRLKISRRPTSDQSQISAKARFPKNSTKFTIAGTNSISPTITHPKTFSLRIFLPKVQIAVYHVAQGLSPPIIIRSSRRYIETTVSQSQEMNTRREVFMLKKNILTRQKNLTQLRGEMTI